MKSIVSSLLPACVIPDFMARLQKCQAWWEKRPIRSKRILCRSEKHGGPKRTTDTSVFTTPLLALFACIPGIFSSYSSTLTALAHSWYGRCAEIKVPLTHRHPSDLFLHHSNLSLSLSGLWLQLPRVWNWCFLSFFPLRFGSASRDLDPSPLSGKLSTPKDPHCYFKLGSLSAVDLLSPHSHHSSQLSCSLGLFRGSPLISAALVSAVIPLFYSFNRKLQVFLSFKFVRNQDFVLKNIPCI